MSYQPETPWQIDVNSRVVFNTKTQISVRDPDRSFQVNDVWITVNDMGTLDFYDRNRIANAIRDLLNKEFFDGNKEAADQAAAATTAVEGDGQQAE